MRIALLLLLIAFEIDGRWWGTATVDGHPATIYVTLLREGDNLRGSGGPTKVDQDILRGRVERGRYVFDLLPAGRSPLHFELTGEADRLKGTVVVRRNGKPVVGEVALTKRTD